MFFKEFNGWVLENSKTVEKKCTNCSNTGDHVVYVAPHGPQLGLVFMKKSLVGMRKYFLVCSICGNVTDEISKEQAMAMKG